MRGKVGWGLEKEKPISFFHLRLESKTYRTSMKLKHLLLFIGVIFFAACQSNGQNRLEVRIPSPQMEAEYIWQTLQDIEFFDSHNYQVSLPPGDLIDELKLKSKSGTLAEEDYGRLEKYITDQIYQEADYQAGFAKIQEELDLINRMINELDPSGLNWKFKEYETYTVNLTLYGPGGSYDPDEGSILLYTTPGGKFKGYDYPANTIIHEVVHIGIEASIVAQYQVPHAMKERIVDTYVSLKFGADLPDYRIQDMGDTRTDPYLQTVADLDDLESIVARLMEKE